MSPKEAELANVVEEIKKNILIINGHIMKVRIKNPIWGVPISFLNKYCPNQFEIVGLGIASLGLACGVQPYKPEHRKYRKNIQKRGVVDGDLYMVENGIVKVPYSRILIQKIN